MAQLRCENISVGYEDGIVVSDVSFELNRGDYVCIVGENGAGKSSLLKGILGLARIQGGKLEYGDGMSRADVGYLPQQKDYQKNFPATVKEVVMSGFLNKMGLRPYYNRAEKAKAMEILSDFGMADYVRASFGSLSGGQKQRVLLARAMCATDKLLLLDEPTTGLDPVATEELYELLKRLNREKKTTILMVSHDLNKAVSDAGLILHVNKRSGCGYFGPADKYLDSEAARHFLGLDYKNSEETDSTAKVPIDRNENKDKDMDKNTGKSLLDKVKKGERYV
ncbi:MAG TPA: ABC transporter [Eubacterium sp.]|nr:ABC transporter [Eubacterium sp.]